MNDPFGKLKKTVLEPKVYAIMVKSIRGQVLHIGVHFSLDEAYSAARKRMETFTPYRPGEGMDIDLWNSIPLRDVMTQSMESSSFTVDVVDIKPDPAIPKQFNETAPAPSNFSPSPFAGIESLPELLNTILNGEPPDALELHLPIPETITDYVNDVKHAKNQLLKKLIETGDVSEVEKLRHPMLTKYDKLYVLKKIAEKGPVDKKPGHPKARL